MARREALVERLPSLYRDAASSPSDTLYGALISAVAESLDEVHRAAGDVLQSRWVGYADRAEYSQFFALARRLDKRLDPERSPYLADLARVAALVPLSPWEQPEPLRESAEQFRLRVRRVVRLYKDGLSTLDAVRAAVEASLPVALDLPDAERDQPFLLEEFAPNRRPFLAIESGGVPELDLGPLARFTLDNAGLRAVGLTVIVQALDAVAAVNPLVELYRRGDGSFARLGLGYAGTLGPSQALRLRPGFVAFAATESGLRRARALPVGDLPANPAVDGPWEDLASAPALPTTLLLQTADLALWFVTRADGDSLWRHDGRSFSEVASDLPEVHALLERDGALLIATATGLLRLPLFPPDGAALAATPVAALVGIAVHALAEVNGQLWLGTARGLFRLGPSDELEPLLPRAPGGPELEVFALHDAGGAFIYVGTELGLFAYGRDGQSAYHYVGAETSEQARDYRAILLDAPVLPGDGDVFLPPVRCIQRASDASLWIGTDRGFARYVARPALTPSGDRVGAGPTLLTALEAYPDLHDGRVYAIREDARGRLWFATERGLFRYDGRDLAQLSGTRWVGLGRADGMYPAGQPVRARGAFRYQRGAGRWQRFDEQNGRWSDFAEAPRSADELSTHTVTWCGDVSAELGSFDGEVFGAAEPVAPERLVVRYKVDETRVLRGGLPALPMLEQGASVWRYLEMESDDYVPPLARPAWTPEGRLLPPTSLGEAPAPARFDRDPLPAAAELDRYVFGYPATARVWASWDERRPRSFAVRLLPGGTALDPAIVERVWQSIALVRPLGVRAVLAVDEKIVKE